MDDLFEDVTNVVRLPSARAARPLIDRVCDVEPDVREVVFAADSLGLVLPASDLRDRVDEEAARHIAEQVLPLPLSEQRVALDGLLLPVAVAALGACEASSWASRRCVSAFREAERARQEGGHWMAPLEERAEMLALEAGRLLVAAYQRCQEARGVVRAVGLARQGEPWTPVGGTAGWQGDADQAGRDGPVASRPAGRTALGVSP